jgi:hypothetical protein
MKCIVTIFIVLFCYQTSAQKNKIFIPANTYQRDSVTIYGIAAGLWTVNDNNRNNYIHGIRLELIGIGLGIPLIPRSPLPENQTEFLAKKADAISERVNGFNLSGTGAVCNCVTNGVVAGLIGQIHTKVNGIMASGMLNFVTQQNGIMLGNVNAAYKINGAQIGLACHANTANGLQVSIMGNGGTKIRGVQIGITNFAYLTPENTADFKTSMPNVIGMQLGGYNNADRITGVQIGIFNKTKHIKGIQIGLWNVNQKRKLPILNWNFKT